jgi:TolB-like protein/Tfp pilus assembly protein PilF
MHELSTPASSDGGTEHAKIAPLDFTLIGAVVLVVGIFLYQQMASTPVEQTAPAQQASIAPPAAPGSISIAVLPFAKLSGDAGQEFFSDGMTEEITSALVKVPNLQVVARTSAFQFKGQNQDVRVVGQALGATHVIEGSVRKAGDRVRITAQLIRADSGLQLWSENYDRQLTDIFAIQEEIAQAVAVSLRVPLGLRQGQPLVSNRTDDLQSYEDYLRARSLFRARALGRAISVLEQAVARDPDFAPAWAVLAASYGFLPGYEIAVHSEDREAVRRQVRSAFDKAEMAATEAIRLDPRHAGGYAALGWVQSNGNAWASADDLYRQALSLDPNDPDVLHLYSLALGSEGRIKLATNIRERLRALEPFVPVYNLTNAAFLQHSGQDEAAIALAQTVPNEGAIGVQRSVELAMAYAAQARYGEAANTLLEAPENSYFFSRKSVEDAARYLRRAPATIRPEDLPVFEGMLNFVYAVLGAPMRVLEAPERNIDVGYHGTVFRNIWKPIFAPVRKTERFKALMVKVGLVDYWRERGWPDLCRPVGADDFVCD